MRVILLLFALISLSSCTSPYLSKDYLMGIVLGMRLENKIPSLPQCTTDAGHTVSMPGQLVDLFKLGAYVQAIQHTAEQLDLFFDSCGDTTVELVHYGKELKDIVRSPNFMKQVEGNIKGHFLAFFNAVKGYQDSIRDKKYFLAGHKLGEIMFIAMKGDTNPL